MKNETKENNNAWGVAGLVTGILGIFLFIMPYFAIWLSIFAMVCYKLQKPRNGMSIAGLVLGILGTIFNGIMLLVVVLLLSTGMV